MTQGRSEHCKSSVTGGHGRRAFIDDQAPSVIRRFFASTLTGNSRSLSASQTIRKLHSRHSETSSASSPTMLMDWGIGRKIGAEVSSVTAWAHHWQGIFAGLRYLPALASWYFTERRSPSICWRGPAELNGLPNTGEGIKLGTTVPNYGLDQGCAVPIGKCNIPERRRTSPIPRTVRRVYQVRWPDRTVATHAAWARDREHLLANTILLFLPVILM